MCKQLIFLSLFWTFVWIYTVDFTAEPMLYMQCVFFFCLFFLNKQTISNNNSFADVMNGLYRIVKFGHLWSTAAPQRSSSGNFHQVKLWIEQNWLCSTNVGGFEGFWGRYCNKNITRRLGAPGNHVQLNLPAWSRPSLRRGCQNNSGLTPSHSGTSQTAISRFVLRIKV